MWEKIRPFRYLRSNNKVDKDVQSMLLSLNLVQHIMFCPKYRIKDNIITPNSLISKMLSMAVTLGFIFFYLLGSYLVAANKDSFGTPFEHVTFYFHSIFYCFGFSMNFVNAIIQTKNNIFFILTFQKVHRFINNKTSFKIFIVRNWILGIVAISFYAFIYTYFILQLSIPFYAAYVGYFIVIFDLNIVYASQVIQMLKNKVILWNLQVLSSQEFETLKGNYSNIVFEAYVHIMECYDTYKVSFQPFILFHILELINSLCYTQVAIETFKKGIIINNMNESNMRSLSVLSWLIKNIMWELVFIQQCEQFYLAIKSVQDTCALVLKSTCSDDVKRLCKNVLRLHRASFSKIRVYGLFHVDAALQLSLMSLLTNFTVMLLQFAFL